MQGIYEYTLNIIEDTNTDLTWLAERSKEWSSLCIGALSSIIAGKTIILITEQGLEWFSLFILNYMNKINLQRPIIPIIKLIDLYPYLDHISGGEKIDILSNMIRTSYGDNYFYWYIGLGNNKRADIAKKERDSFLWLFDENATNSFSLKSDDKQINTKLINLYEIFDKTLNAALFNEIDLSI